LKGSGRFMNWKANPASNAARVSGASTTAADQLTGARGVSEDSMSLGNECYNRPMKIKVIVHDAEEGGYWAEVPAIPGCATQGETFEELLRNLYEAVEGCLSVDVSQTQITAADRVFEIAV
jgi:predicted RNase H-like HicB family nuclease